MSIFDIAVAASPLLLIIMVVVTLSRSYNKEVRESLQNIESKIERSERPKQENSEEWYHDDTRIISYKGIQVISKIGFDKRTFEYLLGLWFLKEDDRRAKPHTFTLRNMDKNVINLYHQNLYDLVVKLEKQILPIL